MKKTTYLFLILIQFAFAQTQHIVLPSATSVAIISPDNNHFVYYNSGVTHKNKLFLFFPGTGAVPFNYKEVLKEAANLGCHAVGLNYPNAEAINTLCQPSVDITCHSRARYEVFDGLDRTTDVAVDSDNCIQNRVIKLLQYLETTYPTENWSQYYSGNNIFWDKIIVSGHSQGGGHAGFISKIKQVDRVVMFAAMDWIPLLNRNADWITWAGPTTSNRYYGFVHENDELANFSQIQTTWMNYGMNNYGTLTNSLTSPYGNSHTLYTTITPDNDPTKFHGCIVADAYIPIVAGVLTFKPVWDYMIDSVLPVLGIENYDYSGKLTVSPNPFSNKMIIKNALGNETFILTNVKGQLIYSGKNIQDKDFSSLQSGVYFLKMYNQGNFSTQKMIKN
jgi:Secretion system C-terminal sorting domain